MAGAGAGGDGQDREEDDPPGTSCQFDGDCVRYRQCRTAWTEVAGEAGGAGAPWGWGWGGRGGCRCRPWGRCEPVRSAGQPCHQRARCDNGLMCGGGNVCVPDTQLEDMPTFPDLPESDLSSHADIPATYGGPLLVAVISVTLVLLCLALAAWCRLTRPSAAAPRLHVRAVSPSPSVLINMNHMPPVPCYAAVGPADPYPPPPPTCHHQHRHHQYQHQHEHRQQHCVSCH